MWKDCLVQLPESVKASHPSEAFEASAKENRENACAHIVAACENTSMDDAIRGELKSMWKRSVEAVLASVRSVLGC